MNEKITKERQPATTAEAAADLAERQTAVAARLTEPPRVGDVYLSRRTADFPVEWLVLDHENGRVRVVLFDDHPFAGSRDLTVTPQTLGGAGVLRCDLDVWIDAADLEPELRTGALTELEVQRVRRKRRAIAEGTPEASLLEEEVDGDPASPDSDCDPRPGLGDQSGWQASLIRFAEGQAQGTRPTRPAGPGSCFFVPQGRGVAVTGRWNESVPRKHPTSLHDGIAGRNRSWPICS